MARKTARLGVFAALAIIFGYLECLIPFSIGIPGVKLGIANIVTVVILYKAGIKEAGIITVVRVVVVGFLFANAFSIIYSLAGCFMSLITMYFLKKKECFSIYGISMAGGVAHNIGQIAMAALLLETGSIWYYLPVLLVSGVLTGLVIGIVSGEMLKRMRDLKITG